MQFNKGRFFHYIAGLVAFIALLFLPFSPAIADEEFTGIGQLPGEFSSRPTLVSDDGSVVVGDSVLQAFRWTEEGGIIGLGSLSGGNRSFTAAMSPDGRIVVGNAEGLDGAREAFYWTETDGMISLVTPSPDINDSYSTHVSDDGSVVAGYIWHSSYAYEPFRWTKEGGTVGLGFLPGRDQVLPSFMSADGKVIVGRASGSPNANRVFRWTEESGMVNLGVLPGGFFSLPSAMTADGQVIAGNTHFDSPPEGLLYVDRAEAFRWTEEGGMAGLGSLPGGYDYSESLLMSVDGNAIAGVGFIPNPDLPGSALTEAFRWTEEDGMVGLGTLSRYNLIYDNDGSRPLLISSDGNVIVGVTQYEGSKYLQEAFRWTEKDGMVSLGILDLEGNGLPVTPKVMTDDGNIIFGVTKSVHSNTDVFRWTEITGMQSVTGLLLEDGIDLTGWSLDDVVGISSDGTVVVGYGYNTLNGNEGWVARIGSGLITPTIVNESVSSLLPTTESSHGLARESLETHMQAARNYRGNPDAKFDLYASGFGGEWNSYTAGGTVGLAVNVTNKVRIGGGVFASRYKEDDLGFSGEYELDALGGTLWAGYAAPEGGPQLHVVGMLAELDTDIVRGYLNGSGLDSSKGDPDGTLAGIMVRSGWEVPVGRQGSVTPFASYSWTEVDIDGYTETGGGFPAQFDSRKDSAEVVRAGLEGEYNLTDSVTAWGQAAYGKRLDDDSDGISGQIVGLTDFAQPGYALDDDWTELDLGFKWHATGDLSVMLTGGSTFGSDQNPDWRSSLGVSWSLM